MIESEYYIKEIDANLHPNLGEKQRAFTHVELEMGDGTYDQDDDILTTEATLKLNLYSEQDHEEDEDLAEPSYGSIEIEFLVYIEDLAIELDEDVDILDEMEKWNSGAYDEVDSKIIVPIESGIMPKLISPLGNLLNNSFQGILPTFIFTDLSDPDEGNIEEDDGENGSEDDAEDAQDG